MSQSTKKTYKEIIEHLKSVYDKVDDFAFNEDTFELEKYPEAVQAEKTRDNFYNQHYKNNKWDSEENRQFYYSLPSEWVVARNLWKQEDEFYFEEIDNYGGEDCGSTWYSVKYFPKHDIYIRVDGYYSSYHGTDFDEGWNCCSEVRPIEKTITVYE